MTVEQLKEYIINTERISIAPEIRPSASKNPDGSLKPFYLTRDFKYLADDKFELTVINSADAYGKIPLIKMDIKWHIAWQWDHPIAAGAQKVNFIADEWYEVTPLIQWFVDILNQIAINNFDKRELNQSQSILRKAFVPFWLAEGQIFAEFDLIYIFGEMMFWWARNIDGRGFDTEENRPANLQIPMIKKQ